MIAGGPYTVRAYDLGVLSGDTGVLGTLEFQHTLGVLMNGTWQANAFFDSERIVVNKTTWVAGTNTATLSGAGVGLNWNGPNQMDRQARCRRPCRLACPPSSRTPPPCALGRTQ
jgi:hemolysin activation/secretion protein